MRPLAVVGALVCCLLAVTAAVTALVALMRYLRRARRERDRRDATAGRGSDAPGPGTGAAE